MTKRHLLLILCLLITVPIIPQQQTTYAQTGSNCQNSSVGFIPINDLGTNQHKGAEGGLYPNGQNNIPDPHLQAGLAIAQNITPRNASGQPDPNGKIGLVSIGMSNTRMEFNAFREQILNDPDLNPALVIVNGAQSGQSSAKLLDPNAQFWVTLETLIAQAGLTPAQVQVVWIKEARASINNEPFPSSTAVLQSHLQTIVGHIKTKYPNVQIAYLSSRIYAGYATGNLSPEPHAYETGFAVKWLIEDQINGSPALNYDAQQGAVNAPWLAWGPYLWADGLTLRSDGLIWECADLANDGTHPSAQGQSKVGAMLVQFFKTEETAVSWFLTTAPPPPTYTIYLPLLQSQGSSPRQFQLTHTYITLQ